VTDDEVATDLAGRRSQRLRGEVKVAINRVSAENESDTPDFILAEYLVDCLAAFDKATRARDEWYGVTLHPGCRKLGGGDQ
jgi:hypothetical protein